MPFAAGVLLLGLAFVDPTRWLLSAVATIVAMGAGQRLLSTPKRSVLVVLVLGVAAPVLLFFALSLVGGSDTAQLLWGELIGVRRGAGDPASWQTLLVVAAAAWLVVSGLAVATAAARRRRAALRGGIAIAAAAVAFRLVTVGSIATLPTDMLTWSEAPFLLDALKRRGG